MRGKYKKLLVLGIFVALGALFGMLVPAHKTEAAINPQINFQGKLTNPDGTNVTDGTYSIRFRIYTDPSADAASTCIPGSNTCKWEETQSSVSVSSGIFQVALGSSTALPGSVDFNTAGLYLGVKVGSDAEMTPRITFTAAPYAFNADQVDGLDAANIVQLANGIQTDSSTTNASIFINKTGTTADIIDLQRGGNSVFNVANDGSTTVQSQTNSQTAFQIQNVSSVPIFVADTTNSVNLLSNPGFEVNTTGWSVAGTGTSLVQNTNRQLSYYGTSSLRVNTASSGNTVVTVNSFTGALAAGTYTFSFYAIGSGAVSGLAVSFGTGTCTLNATTIPATTGWQRFSCTVTTSGATSAITITSSTTGTSYYLDAAQLQTGSNATPYYIGGLQLRGVITNPVSIQPYSDSTTAFQVTNANGSSRLLTVDSESTNDPLEVQIGMSSTVDTVQVLLGLDSFNTFADTATCGTTTNQGALYYNTRSNAVRGCINGGWEDLVSTGGLGLQLFGVVPDSGANPGDIYGTTGVQNGPCKVTAGANTNTVSWTACTAYSGGRKVVVTASTQTTTNTTAGNFQHLCLTGANGQPALSTSGAETANLATASFPSATMPILCLADIRFNGANTTMTQIYDTRTYTTTNKLTTAINSAAGLGYLATYGTTKGNVVSAPSGAGGNNIAGIVVATTGTASSTAINAILATSGPGAVKAVTGTNAVGNLVTTSATVGYATTATARATPGTGVFFTILGNARTAWAGATACSANTDNCAGSVVTDISRN